MSSRRSGRKVRRLKVKVHHLCHTPDHHFTDLRGMESNMAIEIVRSQYVLHTQNYHIMGCKRSGKEKKKEEDKRKRN